MSRNEQNRTTFTEFCEVSTCMGIVDLYNAKTVASKLFWAVMLTVSLGVTIWQTQGVISQFFNESRYKTTVSKQMIDGGVEYPNLTVCNYNRAKQSLINETNLDTKILIYLFQLFPVNYNFPLFVTPNWNITEYENEWIKFKKKTRIHDPKDVFRFYSYNSTETITMVTSENGVPLALKYEEVWTVHGLCWKLMPRKKQLFPGKSKCTSVKTLYAGLVSKSEKMVNQKSTLNFMRFQMGVNNFELRRIEITVCYPGRQVC